MIIYLYTSIIDSIINFEIIANETIEMLDKQKSSIIFFMTENYKIIYKI